MNAGTLVIASGLIPTISLSVVYGTTVAVVLSALLALCVALLWCIRDSSQSPARSAQRPPPAGRDLRRLAPATGRLS